VSFHNKVNKLEQTFGHFLKYEQSIQRQRERINQHIAYLVSGAALLRTLPKEVLVCEINKLYHSPNFLKLADPCEQFKAKF
jgi:hypothetical protein